jgi:hypothetical protein
VLATGNPEEPLSVGCDEGLLADVELSLTAWVRTSADRPYVESGSRTRSPASSPLRTVHAPFGAHGSSLNEGIFRHPVTQRNFRRNANTDGN